MTEPTLFPMQHEQLAHARRTDPDTSHAAARTVKVSKSHAAVLAAFAQHGRMRLDDLVAATAGKLSPSRARSACAELVVKGAVRVVGIGTSELGNEARIFEAV